VGSHWRHLAYTTEPSMCGRNVACCQITLTTCLNSLLFLESLQVALCPVQEKIIGGDFIAYWIFSSNQTSGVRS